VRLRGLWLLRFDGARSGAARGAAGEREQGDVAGPFDRHAEPTLMTSTHSRHAAGQNFAAFLHELGKNVGALVVDQIHLLDTELTDFLFTEKLALAAARTARTTARSAFTASAATTTGAAFAARAATTTVTAFMARRLVRGRSLWSGRL